MRNGFYVAFVSPLIGPGQRIPGGRHDRLAEADAAVVAGDPGVLKDGETSVLQARDRTPEQELVLKDAAGEGHRVEAGSLAQQDTAVPDKPGQAIMEAGRDDFPGYTRF
jgi:hypothetical protein